MKTLIFTLILSSSFSYAADRQVVVSGNCLKAVLPDRGSVDFYSEATNKEAPKALSEATKAYESARDAVKKMNLKDLELSTLENSVREEHSWENNKNVFKGYKARIGLRVYTSEISKLGEVVTKVSKSGIKNIGSFNTDISPAKLKEEQESCLAIAVENAKSKAEKLAKAAGSKVGKAIMIQEEFSEVPQARPYMMKSMNVRMESDASATIDTKAENLSTNVKVSFELN